MLPVKKYTAPTSKKYSSVTEIINADRLEKLHMEIQTSILFNALKRGYTQKDLCAISGTNKSNMCVYVSGKRKMSVDKLKLIINEIL